VEDAAEAANHCYPIHKKDGFNGVDEMLKGYLEFTSNPKLKLSGPTNFSPIVKKIQDEIRAENSVHN